MRDREEGHAKMLSEGMGILNLNASKSHTVWNIGSDI
jgi:hypothetical protein